jgi:ribosomal protein S1
VSDAELQLDVGVGVTGYIKADQITNDPAFKLTENFKNGDKVEAFVIRVSDIEGVAELSVNLDYRYKDEGKAVDLNE